MDQSGRAHDSAKADGTHKSPPKRIKDSTTDLNDGMEFDEEKSVSDTSDTLPEGDRVVLAISSRDEGNRRVGLTG